MDQEVIFEFHKYTCRASHEHIGTLRQASHGDVIFPRLTLVLGQICGSCEFGTWSSQHKNNLLSGSGDFTLFTEQSCHFCGILWGTYKLMHTSKLLEMLA